MTDDYLLQEFHEAGIWLPEELEEDERRLAAMRARLAYGGHLQQAELEAIGLQQRGIGLEGIHHLLNRGSG